MKNIYQNFRIPNRGELFGELLKTKSVKIERIVSSEKIPNKVYKQKQDEWILLLKGSVEKCHSREGGNPEVLEITGSPLSRG